MNRAAPDSDVDAAGAVRVAAARLSAWRVTDDSMFLRNGSFLSLLASRPGNGASTLDGWLVLFGSLNRVF